MTSESQLFETLNHLNRISFRVELPGGKSTAFATTGRTNVAIGERYWNSYDGELYRVTIIDDTKVEAVLEFGCGDIPRLVSFDCEWFTPDENFLHHIAPEIE